MHDALACHGRRRTPGFAKATPGKLFRRSLVPITSNILGVGGIPFH
jgi:hypothetical protein